MKKTVLIPLALGATLLLSACTEQTVSKGSENDATTPVQNHSTASTQKDVASTASTDDAAPEPVGNGLYRISAVPKKEPVTLACAYGTTSRYEGATAEAFGQTFDFSQIPVEYDNSDIPYCVRTDLSTVYFADYFKLYQADCKANWLGKFRTAASFPSACVIYVYVSLHPWFLPQALIYFI